MLSRSSSLLRPPPTSARHFTVSQGRWLSVSMLPGTTGWRPVVFSVPGVETDLSSSKDTLLAIPRPLRRKVPKHPLQVLWCRPWPSPIGDRLGSSSSVRTRTGVTTLQASLDVADWSVARPRFAPGLSTTHGGFATGDLGVSPDSDSHRLAALSLSIGYVITTRTSLLSWRPIFWTIHRFGRG